MDSGIMKKRAMELANKLENYGRLKNDEYSELRSLIKEGELPEWHDLYTSQRVDLRMMHDLTASVWYKTHDDPYHNCFFDMKDLVEMVNAWFEIEHPYKAPNRIAYGWQFAFDKGFDSFRPYLYGCIRNYLNRNNVEWSTLELQIICSLKDVGRMVGDVFVEWENLPDNAY